MVEANNKSSQTLLNLIVIGNAGVGKTSLMFKYVKDIFRQETNATVGIDYLQKKYTSKSGQKCKFKIWDTAGQERYRSLVSSHFKDANGVILCFGLNDRTSFLDMRDWIGSIRQYCKQRQEDDQTTNPIPIVIVGNKLDLE